MIYLEIYRKGKATINYFPSFFGALLALSMPSRDGEGKQLLDYKSETMKVYIIDDELLLKTSLKQFSLQSH